MRFLTCEPNLLQIPNYMDEADIFETDPLAWLNQEYEQFFNSGMHLPKAISGQAYTSAGLNIKMHTDKTLPTHILIFDVLRDKIQDFLVRHHYSLCHEIFHSHIEDGRRSKNILMYCK